MAFYLFKCPTCNKSYEFEKKMNEFFEMEKLICTNKKCKKQKLRRDYKAEQRPIIIPEDFKATNQEDVRKFNYDKGPHVGSLLDSEHD